MGIFSNIFKRNSSEIMIETNTGIVPKSESSESVPFTSALIFGKPLNFTALKLSAVYAAISLISNSIADMPINVKQDKNNVTTIVKNHKIAKLFYNMLQSKHTVIKQIIVDLLLYGNAFIYIKRTDGVPTKLIYLQHGDVQVDYKKEQDFVQYQVCNHDAVPKLVSASDMLHFARDTYDGVNGRGFLFFASDIVKLAGSTQNAATDFFSSGCNLSGVLQFKGRLTDKQKEAIRSQWQMIHGTGVSGGLGVLEGDAEYIPLSQNSADSQMIETREFNVVEIARFFNLNPVMLGDLSHSSYNSIEEAQIEFITHTLLPLINLLEEEINRKMITSSTQYIDIDETAIMQGNKSTVADYVTALVSNGIMTINEARKIIGENPMDGCDDLVIPFTKIEDNIVNTPSEDFEDEQEQ